MNVTAPIGFAWLGLALTLLLSALIRRNRLPWAHQATLVAFAIATTRMALLRFGVAWQITALRDATNNPWSNLLTIALLEFCLIVLLVTTKET